jgi:gluconate:H+ symporter, GntP family
MFTHPIYLLGLAVGAIALLVLLVTWRKMNAFIALLLAALLVGFGSGMAPLAALKVFQDGVGATLGGIAAVIALGAMFGRLLSESGGAGVLARRFNRFFGPGRALWCIVTLSIIIGLVTWFAVGLFLLLPVMVTLARESQRPVLFLAIPMLAFLSVMHGLTPPHPGPVVALDALGANTGMVLLLGFLIGLPTAFIAGPLFAPWAARWVPEGTSSPIVLATAEPRSLPAFGATLAIMILPIALMLLATFTELLFAPGNSLRTVAAFVGHPVLALTVAVLVAVAYFARACQFGRPEMLGFTEKSIAAIGMTLLVVGGGGGFARVLRESGVAGALGDLAGQLHLPPLVYAWLIAAFIRVATGSATVAITTAAGLLAPVLAAHPEVSRELLVISLGFGSLFLSHLNDGGFWIVKESLGLTVVQTLKTWTVMETLIGVVGLLLTVLAGFFL